MSINSLSLSIWKILTSKRNSFNALSVRNLPAVMRYQYFDKDKQKEAEKIFNKHKIKYSKLMNSWCAFVVGCTNLLKENGKLGFVLPAKLLQVSHAKLIIEILIKSYKKFLLFHLRNWYLMLFNKM